MNSDSNHRMQQEIPESGTFISQLSEFFQGDTHWLTADSNEVINYEMVF
ncbi:MAG: hypothetical protein KAH31_06875 [Candidatus Sabulitectum sp.]|nr:hypothetical protein [Candidatus Sabulitectum sp.]